MGNGKISDAPQVAYSSKSNHMKDKLVYLSANDQSLATQLINELNQYNYQIRCFINYNDLLSACEKVMPMAVIVEWEQDKYTDKDVDLLDKLRKGFELCPTVVFVSDNDDVESRLAAVRVGAESFFSKPVDTAKLVKRLDNTASWKDINNTRVLYVVDNEQQTDVYVAELESAGMYVEILFDPLKAIQVSKEYKPEIIILDLQSSVCSGPELMRLFRLESAWDYLSIICLIDEEFIDKYKVDSKISNDCFLVKPLEKNALLGKIIDKVHESYKLVRLKDELEAAIRESQFRTIAMDQHDIVSITDATGKIISVNDKFCEITGYNREELLGKNHRILKSGEHESTFFDEMWYTISQGKVWHGTICNLKKNGDKYWVASTIVPFLDKEGLPYKYVSARTDITPLKMAEEAVRASEARLNFLLSASPVSIYTCHIEPPYAATYISPNVKHYMGYEPDKFTNNPEFWINNIHPGDKQRVLDNLPKLFEDGKHSHEYRFQLSDGGYCWVYDELRLVKNDHGKPVEIIGYWSDISERKEMELELDMSKERLRRGQIYANIGTWDWNIETNGLVWSERIPPLFGYPEGNLETSYNSFLEAIHPEDRSLVIDCVNNSIENDAPYEVEHRVVWPDGTVRWLLERGKVMRNLQGKAVRMLGVVQDIDARKRTEMALIESQSKLAGLFELSPLGIALTDMDGNYLEFNKAFQEICGYPDDELRGLSYWDLTPHEYKEEEVKQLELLESTGRYGPYEKVYRQKNGNLVPIRLNGILVKDDSGLSQIWSIVEDISDSKRVEQELIDARLGAETANHAKSQFLSSMSHELRTPMNAIIGFGQLLGMDRESPLNESQKENIEEIIKASNHLLELINEVLDLSKIESGRVTLSIEAVGLNYVLEEALQLIDSLAQKRNIKINVTQNGHETKSENSQDDQLIVRADRTRIKQILLNLLSNAVKYNNVNGQITVDCASVDNNEIRVSVTDTGNGLTLEQQNSLFEAFNRLGAEKTDIEGTGIGLLITRNLVELMGGSIGVASEPGKGSTFWVQLPGDTLRPDINLGIDIDKDKQKSVSFDIEHTVLYIEDNPANLRLVSQLLGHRPNIRLLTAHEPILGLDLASQYLPDLILLDINLPEIDGFEVLRRLRVQDKTRDIPVFAVSANAMPGDIKAGMRAGFDKYITKPINVEQFLEEIDATLMEKNKK